MGTKVALVTLSPEVAVILAAVRDGRITPEQASAGLDTLARHRGHGRSAECCRGRYTL